MIDAGGLTSDQFVQACRNIGYDLTCGQCASVFYTGSGTYQHDATCTTVTGERDEARAALARLHAAIGRGDHGNAKANAACALDGVYELRETIAEQKVEIASLTAKLESAENALLECND